MLVAAHAVFVARDAGHVLFHAVRLGRAALVAAVLKADTPPKKKRRKNKICTSLFTGSTNVRRKETEREFRSVMVSAKHTALLVKALRAGEAVPGVI